MTTDKKRPKFETEAEKKDKQVSSLKPNKIYISTPSNPHHKA